MVIQYILILILNKKKNYIEDYDNILNNLSNDIEKILEIQNNLDRLENQIFNKDNLNMDIK